MASRALRFGLAQMDPVVGDLAANAKQIAGICREAAEQGMQAVIFPELALSGYPPEDLLLRPEFIAAGERCLQSLCDELAELPLWVVLGYPRRTQRGLINALGVLHRGSIEAEYAKCRLPNYQVFDEKRYFVPGQDAVLCEIAGLRVGLSICEDIWRPEEAARARAAGAELLINANASPYHRGKQQERIDVLRQRVAETGLPILYVNMVGGQDELVFDGGSMAVDAGGETVLMAPNFCGGLFAVELSAGSGGVELGPGERSPLLDELPEVHQALVMGLRSYVEKNHFPGVLLGLSGGIDSALTMVLAADALGSERVSAVMMPTRYTSQLSLDIAASNAAAVGVQLSQIDIEPIFQLILKALSTAFSGSEPDLTEENLQARIRGMILMALSNKHGQLLLSTGNKSEMAVGYSTLYGDMAGGFNPLKDVPKTLVYRLANYRNSISQVIPEDALTRPPSAELRPDQTDQDLLPPYEVLDSILDRYIDRDQGVDEIVAAGVAGTEQVRRVGRMVMRNEYKRRQAAIGIRISRRGFGRDRRYPVSSGWYPRGD